MALPVATSRFSAIGSTSAADLELMASNGYSIYIEGTITRKDGMTCTGDAPPVCTPAPEVRFRWGVPVGLDNDDCPTLALGEGDMIEQVLTLTGDRWFRTDFADDAEPHAARAVDRQRRHRSRRRDHARGAPAAAGRDAAAQQPRL